MSKVAIVTGAGQGIGFAIAKRLVQDGFKVGVLDYNAETAEKAVAELSAENAFADVADVSKQAEVAAAFQKVVDDHWHISPPVRISDKDRVIIIHVIHSTGNFRSGIISPFLPGYIQQFTVRRRIWCNSLNLKEISSGLFCNHVGDNAGVSFFNHTNAVLFPCKRKISY